MKKIKKEIISLLVAIIIVGGMIGALAWQRSREPEPDDAPAPAATIHLVQRTEAELTSVTFQNQDQTHVMLPFYDEHDRREWTWEGIDYTLDTIHTRNKIRGAFMLFANQVVREDIAEAGINLADFGLYPPYMAVTGTYDDGTTTVFHIGNPTIDMNGRFLMMEGSPRLYVINRPLADRFLLGLEDLIDRRLPTWDTGSIEYVFIAQHGHEEIEFKMDEHHELEGMMWLVMQQPFPGREVYATSFEYHVFEQFAEFWINDLVSLHPASLAPYGLDNPSLEFIYQAHHGETHLLFGDTFFREINGHEFEFIYVMFAGRPHVFDALYEPASALFDINVLRFIERFIALVDIRDVERLEVLTPNRDYDIWINHVEGSADIEPTINDNPVDDSAFRLMYRLLIGLSIDFEIESFTPSGTALYTARYILFDEDDVELRFFHYNDNFLAVSVNGADVWFVTNRRNFDMFTGRLYELSE